MVNGEQKDEERVEEDEPDYIDRLKILKRIFFKEMSAKNQYVSLRPIGVVMEQKIEDLIEKTCKEENILTLNSSPAAEEGNGRKYANGLLRD